MHRFYLPPERWPRDAAGGLLIDDPQQCHHARHVVRLKDGDRVEVFDGCGRWAAGRLTFKNRAAAVRIIAEQRQPRPAHRVIVCAIPKRGLFNTIVEKATESGATRIVPVVTTRSDVRPPNRSAGDLVSRWRRVAVAAAGQSGRRWLPLIGAPQPLARVFEDIKAEMTTSRCCAASLHATKGLWRWLTDESESCEQEGLIGAVGPEGDWTEEEEKALERHGFTRVSLGHAILRVETAAFALMTAFMLYRETASS